MLTLNQIIHKAINEALKNCNGNQTKAAISLRISRSTLCKYMDTRFKGLSQATAKIRRTNFIQSRQQAMKELGLLEIEAV